MDAEVGIIGLGTMGSMSMWQLSQKGVSVIGFEQFGIGHDRSAAGGESRIFRMTAREGKQSVPLIQEAYTQWRELEKQTSNNLLTITQGLLIGNPNEEIIKNALESIEEFGLEHEILNYEEAKKIYPQHQLLTNEIMIVDKMAGIIRPDLAIISAIKRSEELGSIVKKYTKVEEIIVEGNIVKVRTQDKEYQFKKLLITTGPWVTNLVGSMKDHISIRRLISTWFASRESSQYSKERFPVFSRSTNGEYFYGVPSLDNLTVKVSLGANLDDEMDKPNLLNRNFSNGDLKKSTELVGQYLPGLFPDPVRTNIYMEGYTRDRNPIIDFSPDNKNIVIACGFSGHGFKYAPAIGKVVTDLILKEKTDFPIGDFSLNRFLA